MSDPPKTMQNASCGDPHCGCSALIVFGLFALLCRNRCYRAAGSKQKQNSVLLDSGPLFQCACLTTVLHNKLSGPTSRSAAADRLDHRPSGNQDQRDQAGVWSSDQDRQPTGRDERPSRDHHRDAGQHQPGPVPHYLLVSTGGHHPLVHCK